MANNSHYRLQEPDESPARFPRQRKLTVPQLASEWGVSPDQVLRLIHGGQLAAINIALKTDGRPRYLVDRVEIDRFERSRTVHRVVQARRRRRKAAGVIKFF
jgi:hypothetical protein